MMEQTELRTHCEVNRDFIDILQKYFDDQARENEGAPPEPPVAPSQPDDSPQIPPPPPLHPPPPVVTPASAEVKQEVKVEIQKE